MDIYVVAGMGTGKTTLSAFDGALKAAGVYNYNLITLSSVIPPNTKVIKAKQYQTPEEEYGDKLYCVRSEIRSYEVGKYLAAGLGWYQFGTDKRGVFVEHEIIGDTKIAVQSEIKFRIKSSLQDLCEARGVKFKESKVRSALAVTRILKQPTSALVIAVYQSESWKPFETKFKELEP